MAYLTIVKLETLIQINVIQHIYESLLYRYFQIVLINRSISIAKLTLKNLYASFVLKHKV